VRRALRRAACAKGLPVVRLHPAADGLVAPTRRVLHCCVLRLQYTVPDRAADGLVYRGGTISCGGLTSKPRPEAHLGHAVCSTYYASPTRRRRSRVPWECLGEVLVLALFFGAVCLAARRLTTTRSAGFRQSWAVQTWIAFRLHDVRPSGGSAGSLLTATMICWWRPRDEILATLLNPILPGQRPPSVEGTVRQCGYEAHGLGQEASGTQVSANPRSLSRSSRVGHVCESRELALFADCCLR